MESITIFFLLRLPFLTKNNLRPKEKLPLGVQKNLACRLTISIFSLSTGIYLAFIIIYIRYKVMVLVLDYTFIVIAWSFIHTILHNTAALTVIACVIASFE